MIDKAIFLDRDGVINKDISYLYKISDFKFIPGIFEACKHFTKLGYKLIIVTNQSGIARGYFTKADYEKLTKWMINEFQSRGITILECLFCPHLPNSSCSCRKPKPGMLNSAEKKFNLDTHESWMIGDKKSDIDAAISAKIYNTILLQDSSNNQDSSTKTKFIVNSIKESITIIKS